MRVQISCGVKEEEEAGGWNAVLSYVVRFEKDSQHGIVAIRALENVWTFSTPDIRQNEQDTVSISHLKAWDPVIIAFFVFLHV